MFKKLCLLTVLMAMVAVTANVAEAHVVTENFSGDGDRILDLRGPGNETTQTLNSELTWGGYNAYTGTRDVEVAVDATLRFSGRVINESLGSYGYTMFETLDIRGTTIDFEAENNEITLGNETGIKLMLRAGGTWYLSDTIVDILDIEDGERRPYSFDPAASTWDQLDGPSNAMLDALADGDEAAVTVIDISVTLTTELADITGGGFLHATDPGTNSALRIDEVVWKSDPWVSIGGGAHDDEWTIIRDTDFDELTETAPGLQFVAGRNDKGWNAITNVDASEPGMTYLWTVTGYEGTEAPSEQEAKDGVLFKRNNRDDATDVIDPNIVFPYRGTYSLELLADNGTRTDVATITNYVLENRAPRVTGFGDLERTRYDGETITLNPNCQDDNYPLDIALTEQTFTATGPESLPFFYNGHSTGWVGVTTIDTFTGIGKGHPMIPDRSPEDPNVTFPVGVVGVYTIVASAHDGELSSYDGDRDTEQIVTVTVRDNQAMEEVIAGEDQLGVKNRDLALEGTITDPDFTGTVDDDDITTRPENNAIKWTVVPGKAPGGATVTFGDDTRLNSKVSFDTAGDYTLKLTVTETSLSTGTIVMEDFVDFTIFSAKVKIKIIKPSDDTTVRFGTGPDYIPHDEKNYGAEPELMTKNGTFGGNWKGYVKFDLNQLPGVVKKTAATFSIMSAESQDANTLLIQAATYGEGGEWFEGDGMQESYVNLYPDTTGVGLYAASDALPVTGKTLDTWVGQNVGGPEAWPNNTRNTFDVSEMAIEIDNKVTFRIHSLDIARKDFYTKEAGLDEDGIEQSPLLRVAYDPNEPFFPAPHDGALQVPVTIAQLGWKLFGADKATEECEVFFGTDPSPSVSIGMVSKLDLPNHMTDPNMVFDLSAHVTLPLAQATTYYWYVKPTYGNPSQIYSFSTTDQPVNTNPADGATGINPGNTDHMTFEWNNAADSFDIYISQIEEDVNTLDPAALVKTDIVGNEWLAERDLIEFILSGDLDYGGVDEVYFWRVVAKSSTGSDAASEMTSFEVNNYERIDNFGSTDTPEENYTTVVEGSEYENSRATWTAVNAEIFYQNNFDVDADTGENDPNNDGLANDGSTALRLEYDDDGTGISTAKCVFAEPRDWSQAINRAAMKIQLHGDPGNDLEQITLTVTDTGNNSDSITVAKDDDDIAELMVREPWNGFIDIDVALPTGSGIDLSSVKGYSISVGDGLGTEKGVLYIDTVTVRSVRCFTAKIPYYFINNDCAADVNEVELLAEKWLLDITPSTTTVDKGSEPATGPVLHHTFDGAQYNDDDVFTGVANSNELTRKKGSLPTGTHQSTDVKALPYITNTHSMLVDSTHRMETTSFTNLPTGSATVSIWVKPDNVTDNLRTGTNYGTIYGQRPFRIGIGKEGNYWRLNAFNNDGDAQMAGSSMATAARADVDVYALEGTWFHLAYVHDYDKNSSAIYVNGLMIDENTDIEEMLPFPANPDNMRMPHNADNHGFNGLIDEFRLYDYTLTQPEILFLADVASVEQPVITVNGAGDINNDYVFNMADLAELAEGYQNNGVLWP